MWWHRRQFFLFFLTGMVSEMTKSQTGWGGVIAPALSGKAVLTWPQRNVTRVTTAATAGFGDAAWRGSGRWMNSQIAMRKSSLPGECMRNRNDKIIGGNEVVGNDFHEAWRSGFLVWGSLQCLI
jgi:hypothetical protein